MLIRLLFVLLAFALFRFIIRLVKTLLSSTRGPELHTSKKDKGKDPVSGDVVDVEFTEEKIDAKGAEDSE